MWVALPKNIKILVITIFAFALRLLFFNNVTADNTQDPYWFVALSKGILEGRYEIEGTFHSVAQPLFPFLTKIITVFTGDYFFSMKAVSVFSGLFAVIVTYKLFETLESKNVGLLSAYLVSVNPVIWEYSVRPYTDSLYLFFSTLSLFILFKAKKNYLFLPLLSLSLSLAILSRNEGYILAAASIISYIYWKRLYITNRIKISGARAKIIISSILISLFFNLPWLFFKIVKGGGVYSPEVESIYHLNSIVGIDWFNILLKGMGPLFFVVGIIGVMFSLYNAKRRTFYMPLFLYLLFYSILHFFFVGRYLRYAMPLMPILYGFFSIIVFKAIKSIPRSGAIVLLIFIGVYSFGFGVYTVENNLNNVNRYVIVKDAMDWINSNSEVNDSILVGDKEVYSYYTARNVIGHVSINFYNENNDYSKIPIFNLMLDKNITYMVAYDSLTPNLYNYSLHNFLTKQFSPHEFRYEYQKTYQRKTKNPPYFELHGEKHGIFLRFTPILKFDKNNDSILLYKIESSHGD